MISIEDVLMNMDEKAYGFQFSGKINLREVTYIIDMNGKPVMTVKGSKGECTIEPPHYETKPGEGDVIVLKKVSGKVSIRTKAGLEREIKGYEAEVPKDQGEIIKVPSFDSRQITDMYLYSSAMNLFKNYIDQVIVQKALAEYKGSKKIPSIDDYLD